jgi:hypothetical protein
MASIALNLSILSGEIVGLSAMISNTISSLMAATSTTQDVELDISEYQLSFTDSTRTPTSRAMSKIRSDASRSPKTDCQIIREKRLTTASFL